MFKIWSPIRCRQAFRLYSSNIDNSAYESVREQCRKFAKEVLKPIASKIDHAGIYPQKEIDQLAKLGFMGITVPAKYGGSDMDMSCVSLAVEELSRGCSSTGAIVSIHNILYADFLSKHGSETQKDRFLSPYTCGVPGAFALSEAEAGSDVANISTTATESEKGFLLNGLKSWVTSGFQAEVAIVFATVNKSLGRNGITAFLVPLQQDGVTCCDSGEKMGIRGTSTCEIQLSNVFVPCDNVVGEVGQGFKLALQQLNRARIGIASQALGIAQASLDAALDYAMNRRAFGGRLVDFQAVQLRLATMASKIEAARLLVRQSARMCDRNEDIIKSSAMAKLMASEAATFSANECVQILGGMGYVKSMPAERYYRDAKITQIYGGVSDVQMLVIAEQLIKEQMSQA